MLAVHLIFGCYGFWLPNDPRGSWSVYVRNRKLLEFGEAKCVSSPESVARTPHDTKLRAAAKRALHYPAVQLDELQIQAVCAGFIKAQEQSGYLFFACAIMPDHVHVVVRSHHTRPKQIIGHLKGNATRQMCADGIHPLAGYQYLPSPWSRGGWAVFLDTEESLQAAVSYVEQNPVEAGQPRQSWPFCVSMY